MRGEDMSIFIGSKALTAKPSSIIRSDYNAFSSMCHKMDEPILITRNGESDLVVMSHKTYNDMIERMRITVELMEADRDLNTAPTVPASQVFSGLREMINEQLRG
jgi:PHD/YefM family antitoxin component YafN of YafNO toxin-antitoxin module